METKQDPPWFGCLGVCALVAVVASCWSGGSSDTAEIAQSNTAEVTTAIAPQPTQPQPSSPSGAKTEDERIALMSVDPDMKAASNFVGALINVNGHLCAQVINVVPAGGSNYEVTCVQYRSGKGRVRYLVNGETNSARPL